MPTLPAAADFTGAAITEAQFKTAITDQRGFLADLLGTAGTVSTALTALGAVLNAVSAKTTAYTVVAGDRGKLIDATTGTWTLTLTAAATLGAGFAFAVRNSGTGVITIDPNSAELIDGEATITVAEGESFLVVCNGTAFKTVGRTVIPEPVIAIRQVVSATIPAATASTAIPDDTTTPLVSEGTEIATLTITPASASNKVKLSASFSVKTYFGNSLIAAVFRGTTCIGAARLQTTGGTTPAIFNILLEDSPATTSATTYTIRFGASESDTWYVNRTVASATALGSMMANSRFYAEELTA